MAFMSSFKSLSKLDDDSSLVRSSTKLIDSMFGIIATSLET